MTWGEFRISGDLSADYPADDLRPSQALGCDLGAILCVYGAYGGTLAPPQCAPVQRGGLLSITYKFCAEKKELPPTVRLPSPDIGR